MQSRLTAIAAVAAGTGLLLARLVPDVRGKPLFEDEAVAGLISARPFPEIVVTTLWDRGGAPLHFVLVHVAFAFDTSPEALRWLSVVFALATVLVTFDLGRRLGGPVAGATAALVAASSGMLAVYGSFGRMYALFAFAAAVAADLFVRALEVRTGGAAALAAAAAWLLPAVHPYGGVVVAVEGVVALVLWRGRPLRAGLAAAAIGLAMVPFAVADLRLANRFEVSGESTGRLATGGEAWDLFVSALRGFAGGQGVLFALFLTLALAGLALAARREPAFAVYAALSLALPALLIAVVPTGRAPDLSPRHLIFALPAWATLVGVTVAAVTGRAPRAFQAGAVAALAVAAALSPYGIRDPRSVTFTARLGSEDAVAAASSWLEARVGEGDVLFPYSSVFLAALPESGRAVALPRAQAPPLVEMLDRVDFPVRRLYVAVPLSRTKLDVAAMRAELPVRFRPHRLGAWLIVEVDGPFGRRADVLRGAARSLVAAKHALRGVVPEPLAGYLDLNLDVLCKSLRTQGADCVTE